MSTEAEEGAPPKPAAGTTAGRPSSDPARGVRRALWVATGAVVAAWAVLLLVWADGPFALTFDDAYYYLAIGRNLAEGAGSSFDGINPTNGYHPLWQGVAALPFVAGLDGADAARALLLVGLAAYGVALLLLADLVARAVEGWSALPPARRRESQPWATAVLVAVFVLVAANPYVVKVFVNGLESSLVAASWAAVLWLLATRGGRIIEHTTARGRIAVSVLLGVTFLARTDAVLLFATLGLWTAAEVWRARPRRPAALVQLWLVPALVVAGYLAANQAAFGTPMQISGVVKRAPLTSARVAVVVVALVLAALALRAAFRRSHTDRPRRSRFPLAGRFTASTAPVAVAGGLVIVYYTQLQTQLWLWYFAPVVLWLVAALLHAVADFTLEALRPGLGETAPPPRALALPAGLLVGVFGLAFVAQSMRFADPDVRSIQVANRDAGAWIDANLPDDAVLASWDAGVVGYFAGRPVVNLDGVVNSREYYDATRQGAGAVGEFLRCSGVGFVVNHGTDVDGEDPDIRPWLERTFGSDVAASAVVEHVEPFTFTGTTTGSGGRQAASGRTLAVHVYRASPGPPGSPCV